MHWWRKLWRKAPEAPRRSKSYLADSGYAYEYRFEDTRKQRNGDVEYTFQVRGRTLSVIQQHSAVTDWRTTHGRDLTADERLGIAQMALRNALDQAPTPAELPSRIVVDAAAAEDISSLLDL